MNLNLSKLPSSFTETVVTFSNNNLILYYINTPQITVLRQFN